MKKIVLVITSMIALLILSACNNGSDVIGNTSTNNIHNPLKKSSQTVAQISSSSQSTPTSKDSNSTIAAFSTDSSDNDDYLVIRDGYNKGKDIAITYPQIKGLNDDARQNSINNMLKQEAMSYLNNNVDMGKFIILDISYDITWKGNNVLSVQYYGWGEVSDAPHPYNLSSILNINIKTGKKIKLQDMFHINQKLITSITKKGSYTGPLSPDDAYLMKEVHSYINSMTMSNFPNMNFYFTKDSFGLLFDVSHAVGEYAMFETQYSDLKSYIDSGSEIWKDFEDVLNKEQNGSVNDNQGEVSDERRLSDIEGFTEIKDQSFDVDLGRWGEVRFVSGKDYQGKLLFFLTDGKDTIKYQFDDYYDSYRKDQSISAVAFRDVNKDGFKDIIVMTASDSKATACDIYFQTEYSFVQIP
ncbi:MAG TPA: hypothetical protein VHQ24_06630, partial [Lachnospiraceae bacterium]|nr:hypothetical protein [Lachnospiraceae bacterium]